MMKLFRNGPASFLIAVFAKPIPQRAIPIGGIEVLNNNNLSTCAMESVHSVYTNNKRTCFRRGKSRLIGPINAARLPWNLVNECRSRDNCDPAEISSKRIVIIRVLIQGSESTRRARCCANELGRATRKCATWLIQLKRASACSPARSRQQGGRHFARIINLNAKLLPEEAARWLSGWSAVGAVHNYAFLVVLRRAPAAVRTGCLKTN